MHVSKTYICKLTAAILTLALIFTSLPVTVSAQEQAVSIAEEENVIASDEPYVICELTEKRDENTKHFKMSDGTIKACVYSENVHFLNNGVYEEIDNTLTEETTGDKKHYKNIKNNFTVKIPEFISDDYIEFSDENGYVKFKYIGAAKKKLEKVHKQNKTTDVTAVENTQDRAVFKSVNNDIDIEYDITSNSLKETIVLHKKTKESFVFDVKTNAAVVTKNNDGSISFYDKDDTEIYTIAAPYMIDANGEYSTAIKVEITKSTDSYKVIYTADHNWLSDKNRAYPVRIDPTIFPEYNFKTIKDSTASFSSRAVSDYAELENEIAWLKVGRRENVEVAALLYVELPDTIPQSARIVKATLALCGYCGTISTCPADLQLNVYKITSDWNQTVMSSSVLYADSSPATPSYDSTVIDYAVVNDSNSSYQESRTEFDITRVVQEWHSGEVNRGVMIKANSYPSSDNFARFYDSDHSLPGSDPAYIFYYRDTVGLEDYWSYHTQSVGAAGIGYLNDFNGNVCFQTTTLSSDGLLQSASVCNYYNSNNSSVDSVFGYGWTNSYNIRLQTETVNDVDYFCLTDSDGTKHYFIDSDGELVDEDGLGYKLIQTSSSDDWKYRKVLYNEKTELVFSIWGTLTEITDKNQNSITLEYGYSNTFGVTLTKVTDANNASFVYTYNSDATKVTSITNTLNQQILCFGYTNGYLTSLRLGMANSTENLIDVTYGYHQSGLLASAIDNKKNYGIDYSYLVQGGTKRISAIKEYVIENNTKQYGNELSIQYKIGNVTVYTDGGLDGKISTTADNNTETIQFDNFGQPVCAYDDEGNSLNYQYNADNTQGRLTLAGSAQKTVANYLNDAHLTGSGWMTYQEYNSGIGTDAVGETPNGYINTSMYVRKETESGRLGVKQDVVLNKGIYTFSIYAYVYNVKPSGNASGTTAEVRLYSDSNRSNQTASIMCDTYITGTADETVNGGYQRLSVTFTSEKCGS